MRLQCICAVRQPSQLYCHTCLAATSADEVLHLCTVLFVRRSCNGNLSSTANAVKHKYMFRVTPVWLGASGQLVATATGVPCTCQCQPFCLYWNLGLRLCDSASWPEGTSTAMMSVCFFCYFVACRTWDEKSVTYYWRCWSLAVKGRNHSTLIKQPYEQIGSNFLWTNVAVYFPHFLKHSCRDVCFCSFLGSSLTVFRYMLLMTIVARRQTRQISSSICNKPC